MRQTNKRAAFSVLQPRPTSQTAKPSREDQEDLFFFCKREFVFGNRVSSSLSWVGLFSLFVKRASWPGWWRCGQNSLAKEKNEPGTNWFWPCVCVGFVFFFHAKQTKTVFFILCKKHNKRFARKSLHLPTLEKTFHPGGANSKEKEKQKSKTPKTNSQNEQYAPSGERPRQLWFGCLAHVSAPRN